MNEQLAKQVIAEAINVAIKHGCFDLLETTNIVKALEVISQLTIQPNENNG